MKNYKAEVTKILDGIGGIHEANEVRTKIVFSLIREIVQEACDKSTFCYGADRYETYMKAKDAIKSEILSNVEELIGGDK